MIQQPRPGGCRRQPSEPPNFPWGECLAQTGRAREIRACGASNQVVGSSRLSGRATFLHQTHARSDSQDFIARLAALVPTPVFRPFARGQPLAVDRA